MRVMHLHPAMELGGGEASIVGLVNALVENSQNEVLLAAAPGPMTADLSCKVDFIKLTQSGRISRCWELSRLLRSLKPDVLHVHSVGFAGMLFVSRLLACSGACVIVTKHAKGFKGIPRQLAGITLRMVADRYIALSPEMRAELIVVGVDDSLISVVPHVIEASQSQSEYRDESLEESRESYQVHNGDFVVSIAARLASRKGLHEFIDVIARLHQSGHPIKGLIVGTGELELDLQQYANDLNVQAHIVFAGFRSDISALLSVTDVVLTMSEEEVLPVFVLEAMADGVPVVARNLPEFANVIQDEHDGFLVNDIEAATNVIGALIEDDARLAKVSQSAAASVHRRYRSEVVVNELQRVYSASVTST